MQKKCMKKEVKLPSCHKFWSVRCAMTMPLMRQLLFSYFLQRWRFLPWSFSSKLMTSYFIEKRFLKLHIWIRIRLFQVVYTEDRIDSESNQILFAFFPMLDLAQNKVISNHWLPNHSKAEWPEREATKALMEITTSCL